MDDVVKVRWAFDSSLRVWLYLESQPGSVAVTKGAITPERLVVVRGRLLYDGESGHLSEYTAVRRFISIGKDLVKT